MRECMDFITLLLSAQFREISATAILVLAVIGLFAGWLVPGRTHKRELAAANREAAEHRKASEKKDEAISSLLRQNSNLLAGVRIADKFYRDFIPSIDERTTPTSEVPHVGT